MCHAKSRGRHRTSIRTQQMSFVELQDQEWATCITIHDKESKKRSRSMHCQAMAALLDPDEHDPYQSPASIFISFEP